MRTRPALAGAAVLAAILVTAGIAGALSTGAIQSDAQPAQNAQTQQMGDTITVGGSGTVQTEADRAVVRVAVVASGDDIGTVREQLSENTTSMRDALAEIGIDESQVRTSYYDISSRERYGGPREEEGPTYRGIHSFAVTVEDTDSVGQVIDTAVSNGASEVDGVEFTLSEDRRQELRQEALTEAMDNARTEASTIADAEDLSITGVDRVSTTDFDARPHAVEARAFAGDGGGAPTSINSGPVTVRASATVVYDTSG